jgi:hypothetical protein
MLGNVELVLNQKPDRALRYYEKVVQIGGDYERIDRTDPSTVSQKSYF